MKKYVVERNLPGIGASSKEDIAQAATTSCITKYNGLTVLFLKTKRIAFI